jgi:hypothetical protein
MIAVYVNLKPARARREAADGTDTPVSTSE